MQACETCVGLLGANRFCQVFSQKPHSGFVTLPSLQQGWRGWTGTQGPRRGWRSGWSARGRKKREGEGGGGGWGDWNWNMSWVEQRGAKPERQPASEVTPPPPSATANHNPKSSTGGTGVTLRGIRGLGWQGKRWHAGSWNPVFGFISSRLWSLCLSSSSESLKGITLKVNLRLETLEQNLRLLWSFQPWQTTHGRESVWTHSKPQMARFFSSSVGATFFCLNSNTSTTCFKHHPCGLCRPYGRCVFVK